MMTKPRKCKCCGKDIIFEKDRESCLFTAGSFYHITCFSDWKKSMRNPWSDDRLGVFLPPAIEEAKSIIDKKLSEEREKQNKKRLARVDEEKRKAFFDFIRDTYAPAIVPNRFYIKLQRIVFGTDPKITSAIPAEYLHDEWKRMLPELSRIDTHNRSINKIIADRWNYDLAIVLSRYPSYLAWRKRQQKSAEEAATQVELLQTKIKARTSSPVAANHESENNEIDISSILDEI